MALNLKEVFAPAAIAAYWTNDPTNAMPFASDALFPAQKKAGLDLKWIRGHKGVGVSLMPSAFDAKATFRTREGFKFDETEMPFFREGYHLGEKDRQEILRVLDSNDPYARDVVKRIYDDVSDLVTGARIVPERMIWQLLAPANGTPGITIKANGVNYTYNSTNGCADNCASGRATSSFNRLSDSRTAKTGYNKLCNTFAKNGCACSPNQSAKNNFSEILSIYAIFDRVFNACNLKNNAHRKNAKTQNNGFQCVYFGDSVHNIRNKICEFPRSKGGCYSRYKRKHTFDFLLHLINRCTNIVLEHIVAGQVYIAQNVTSDDLHGYHPELGYFVWSGQRQGIRSVQEPDSACL